MPMRLLVFVLTITLTPLPSVATGSEIEEFRQEVRDAASQMKDVAPLLPEIMRELRQFQREIEPLIPGACEAFLIDPQNPNSKTSQAAKRACQRIKDRTPTMPSHLPEPPEPVPPPR